MLQPIRHTCTRGRIYVRHGAIIGVRRFHGTRVVLLWMKPPIIAIDRLANWRRALHHVDGLARHGRSTIGHPHLRLRCHGLGAACHGRTGAEDVCKCRVPCSCGLAIVGTARKLAPLLIAVVGHVKLLGSARVSGYTRCIRRCCRADRLLSDAFGGGSAVVDGATVREGRA